MKFIKYCFLAGVLMAMFIGACNKDANDYPAVAKTTKLKVINAVTDLTSIDFYINGTRQNTSAALPYLSSTAYLSVSSGVQQYQFKSDTDRTLLADVALKIDTGKVYSLLVAGQQRSGVSPILLTDTIKSDTTKTAKVRFVQASPGTALYDVFVGDTVSFKNRAFKSFSGFVNVGPGVKKLKVYTAGTSNLLINTTITVYQNSFYTLYTKGTATGTGNSAFGAVLFLSQ